MASSVLERLMIHCLGCYSLSGLSDSEIKLARKLIPIIYGIALRDFREEFHGKITKTVAEVEDSLFDNMKKDINCAQS